MMRCCRRDVIGSGDSRPARWWPLPRQGRPMKTRLLSFGALLALVASMTISWSAPALAATGSTAIPAPPGGSNPDLDALACPSATTCIAVGQDGHGAMAAIDIDGAWTSTELPIPPDAADTAFVRPASIACSSDGTCVAVGSYEALINGVNMEEGLVETYSAGSWSVTPVDGYVFFAVTCPAAGHCLAAGGSPGALVILSQSAGSWEAAPVALPSDITPDSVATVTGIACPADGTCIGVGSYFPPSGQSPMLVTETNGAWQASAAPSTGTSPSELTAVSCPPSGACTAVGTDGAGGFAISGSATTWSDPAALPAPSAAATGSSVAPDAVSCPTALSCATAGGYVNQSDACVVEGGCSSHPFVDFESGGSWSAASVPVPADPPADPSSRSVLAGIACASAGRCVAAGNYQTPGSSPDASFAAILTQVPVTRLFGQDAIGTSIAVAQAEFPTAGSAKAVVVARSDFFTDALAGGPLAAAVDGPLLITPGASITPALDPRVEAEIQRVRDPGGTVYILGGPLALDPAIDAALQGLGYTTKRVAGDDEYATAVAVAEQLGNPTTVFEATGLNFADALSAVPAAIQAHGAILLTDGAVQSPETQAYLQAHAGDTRYAIGGPAAAAGADPTATAVYGLD